MESMQECGTLIVTQCVCFLLPIKKNYVFNKTASFGAQTPRYTPEGHGTFHARGTTACTGAIGSHNGRDPLI